MIERGRQHADEPGRIGRQPDQRIMRPRRADLRVEDVVPVVLAGRFAQVVEARLAGGGDRREHCQIDRRRGEALHHREARQLPLADHRLARRERQAIDGGVIDVERRPAAQRGRAEDHEVLEHHRADRRPRQRGGEQHAAAHPRARQQHDREQRHEQHRMDHRAQQRGNRQHGEAERQPAAQRHAQQPRHQPVIIELLREQQHGGRHAQPRRDDEGEARPPGHVAQQRMDREDAAQRDDGVDRADDPRESRRPGPERQPDHQVEQWRLAVEIPERAPQMLAQQREVRDLHPARQIVRVEPLAERQNDQPHRDEQCRQDQRRSRAAGLRLHIPRSSRSRAA